VELPDDVDADLAGELRTQKEIPPHRRSERTAAPFRCELVKNRGPGWRRSAFGAYKCVSGLLGRRPKSPQERRNVKKALAVALIVGFLLVDFLFFHDIFKAGEAVTFAQYLTGVMSIPVLVVSALYLLRGTWPSGSSSAIYRHSPRRAASSR
jgi:hypothetical protein